MISYVFDWMSILHSLARPSGAFRFHIAMYFRGRALLQLTGDVIKYLFQFIKTVDKSNLAHQIKIDDKPAKMSFKFNVLLTVLICEPRIK